MLTFNAEKHIYKWGPRVLPSVTQIIAPLYAGALDAVKADVLERKRTIGQALHLATQLHDEGRLDEASIDDAVKPYFAAYLKFVAERQPKWSVIEEPHGNPILGYAGTIDRAGWIGGVDGPALCDFKTVAELHPAVGAQLAGYARLMNARGARRFALQLLPSGDYKLVPFESPDDDSAFMGCLSIYHWRAKRAA
jgi:hypothetical protein